MQRRIDTNPVISGQLLRVHPAHGRADDEVRLLLGAQLFEQVDGRERVHGQVGRDHRRLRQQEADPPHRPAGSGRGETMDIQNLLAGKQPRPGVFIQFHGAKLARKRLR